MNKLSKLIALDPLKVIWLFLFSEEEKVNAMRGRGLEQWRRELVLSFFLPHEVQLCSQIASPTHQSKSFQLTSPILLERELRTLCCYLGVSLRDLNPAPLWHADSSQKERLLGVCYWWRQAWELWNTTLFNKHQFMEIKPLSTYRHYNLFSSSIFIISPLFTVVCYATCIIFQNSICVLAFLWVFYSTP